MRKIIGLISYYRQGNELDELADELAAESRSKVWNSVGPRVRTMRLPEARGYMRAKCRPELEFQLRTLELRRGPLSTELAAELIEVAADRLVKLLVTDLLAQNWGQLSRRAA